MDNSGSENNQENEISEGERSDPEYSKLNFAFDLLRVTPPKENVEKNKKTDRLTDLLVILFIFGIAFWFRFFVRTMIINNYGEGTYTITIIESDPLGFGSYLGLAPGDSVPVEGFHDFYSYYIPYVRAFGEGWNPYSGSITEGDSIGGYVYGPLYIYSISIGHIFFGMSPEDSIVYSNIILDSLTYVMVYILGKRVTGNMVAMLFAVLGSFSPIALFYIGVRGLNAPLMNFLFLVFLYFYLEKRDVLAALFLALATLTKQFPLLFALPFGFWMFRRHGILKGLAYILLFIFFFFLFSIPYLLITPYLYIVRMFMAGRGKTTAYCPDGGEATNLFHGIIPTDQSVCRGLGSSNPIDMSELPSYAGTLFFLVNSHILFFGSIIVLGWIAFTAYDYMEDNPKLYFIYTAAFVLVAHGTIARGIYKYYITFLVPLMILALLVGDPEKSINIQLGASLNRSWRAILNQKDQINNYKYWGMLIPTVLSTIGTFWLLDAAISMFSTEPNIHKILLVITIPLAIYFIINSSPVDEINLETISDKSYAYRTIVIVILAIVTAYIANPVVAYYFNDNSDSILSKQIIISVIIILFLLLPYLNRLIRNNSKTRSFISFSMGRFILDIIGTILALIVLNLFHIQILLTHRYYTSVIVLAYGILFMGMLGNEVWISGLLVPIRVWKQIKLFYRRQENLFNISS